MPTGRRPAVLAFDHLDIGTADTDRNGFDQHRAIVRIRLWNVFEASAPGGERFDRDCLHVGVPLQFTRGSRSNA